MRISTRGRYGLRAVVDIATKMRDGAAVVSNRSIAGSQGISENYLEQIMAQLKESGIVASIRGAGGGFRLKKPPEEISAGEILRAVEGSLSPAECLDSPRSYGTCAPCEECSARGVLSLVYESVTEVVDSITVLDIMNNKHI